MSPARRRAPVIAFAALLAAALTFGAAVSAQTPPSGTALVDAQLGWQSTGLSVQAGTPLRLAVVSGLWTYWIGGSPPQPGTGDNYVCALIMPPSTCIEPMPFERKGALIGRIGSTLFLVGQASTVVAAESGILEFRMNDPDSALHDNDGVLTVAINPGTPSPSATPTAPGCPPGNVCITWTPTPTASTTPSPSATPSLTSTEPPPPSPTPTETRTPEPAPCVPALRPLDTVLVMDRSTSMGVGGKWEAARRAIEWYVDAAALPPGRVGLVSFAGVAGVNQALTTDRARFKAALQAIELGAGTRIDLGLRAAREALALPGGAPDRAPVIILLSDGVQNTVPGSTVLEEADRAKAEGVIVFTIGLGADVDAALLRSAATSPAHYFFAPAAADLAGIYRQVAVAIPCSALGGMVFVDRDADGGYDPAVDAPLADLTLRLAGPVTRSTRSGPAPALNYRFQDIPAGRYTVQVDPASLPFGLVATTNHPRSVDLNASPREDIHLGFARVPMTPGTPTRTASPPISPTPGDPSGPSATPGTPGAEWKSRCYLPWAGS